MAEKKPENKIEREYIIPLREKSRAVPRYRKTPKAIKTIKEFLARHMRVENRDLKKVKIDKHLNEFMWAHGIKKHPHKVKVKVTREGENIRVELVDYPNKLKFKKLREEKRGKDALESVDKKKTMMQRAKESLHKPEGEKVDEKKKEEKIEREKTSAEATQELEKARAKSLKHQAGGKTKEPKRPVRQSLQK